MTVTVLIADDEHLVRAGLRALIQAEPDLSVVGEAGTGAQAVTQARQLRPDVVLMDVRMPERTGIEATAEILATMPEPPRILIVTTFENDDYVYAALREGASGFLLKRARPAEILHAIRLIAQGTTLLYPTAIRDLVRRFGRPPARDALRSARLTDREATVLRLIAAGLSNAEIGARLHLGNETVKTHVGNVLTKLHARDRTQAVITAYETGFITPA
jgi:DNA-binding NarL/FixJ family response regulator